MGGIFGGGAPSGPSLAEQRAATEEAERKAAAKLRAEEQAAKKVSDQTAAEASRYKKQQKAGLQSTIATGSGVLDEADVLKTKLGQ